MTSVCKDSVSQRAMCMFVYKCVLVMVCMHICFLTCGVEGGRCFEHFPLAEIFSLATRKRDPACRGTAVCDAARASERERKRGSVCVCV